MLFIVDFDIKSRNNKYCRRIWFAIALCVHAGQCSYLSNVQFQSNSNAPTGNGVWTASCICKFSFPGQDITVPGSGYVYTRFSVPFRDGSYIDYLGGSGIHSKHAGNQWLIANVGYATSNGALDYSFDFQYDTWLGSQPPGGECYLFNNLADAVAMSTSTDILAIPQVDSLLASAPMIVTSISTVGGLLTFQFMCSFTFSGIRFGDNEACVYHNFTAPITNYYVDYSGNTPLHSDPDYYWKIVQYTYAGADTASITFIVKVTNEIGTAIQNNGRCYMYARDDAALLAADPPPPPSTTTTATTAAVAAVTVAPFVYVPIAKSSILKEISRDRDIGATVLWTTSDHVLACSRKCHVDKTCKAIWVVNGQCSGVNDFQETGDDQPGAFVYEIQ